jgi:low affinity Fe/Cu permease
MKIILPREVACPQRASSADVFRRFAQQASKLAGTPSAFSIGVAVVAVWALSGHLFGYSENWQLVINTGTTIVTFLMVFLIQNTQARDSKELHLKLDELLRAVENARNTFIASEALSDDELDELEREIHQSAIYPSNEKERQVERI